MVKRSRLRVGQVVSDKMQKTVVVAIRRRVTHPLYGKIVSREERVKAHDDKDQCRTGDTVAIAETRPLSKEKRWKVVSVINTRKAQQ